MCDFGVVFAIITYNWYCIRERLKTYIIVMCKKSNKFWINKKETVCFSVIKSVSVKSKSFNI
jgi:hypothetical protein